MKIRFIFTPSFDIYFANYCRTGTIFTFYVLILFVTLGYANSQEYISITTTSSVPSVQVSGGANLPSNIIYGQGKPYKINNGFGSPIRIDGVRMNNPHNGLDIDTPHGTPLRAPLSGLVFDIKNNPYGGKDVYIKNVLVASSAYFGLSHLSKVLVEKNDQVTAGQIIGYSGTSESGPHTHLSARVAKDGKYVAVDPLPYYLGVNGKVVCASRRHIEGSASLLPKLLWPACRDDVASFDYDTRRVYFGSTTASVSNP